MAQISNGESGLSARNKLNEVIDKIEGNSAIGNNLTITGTLTSDGLTVDGSVSMGDILSIESTTGYGSIEMGGPNGAYIDFKSPFSDDYDSRILTNGTDLDVTCSTGSIKLIADGGQKLATTSTGVDITGTLTSDGLTVDGDGTTNVISAGGANDVLAIKSTDNTASLSLVDTAGSVKILTQSDGRLRFYRDGDANSITGANSKLALSLEANGDISFFENTGTTEKLHWSAADESLTVTKSNDNGQAIVAKRGNGNWTEIGVFAGTNDDTKGMFQANNNTGEVVVGARSNHPLLFTTNNSEAMRIDSSGNLLVGTTVTYPGLANTTAGVSISSDAVWASISNNVVGSFNRLTSDGDILQFRKDGGAVGSIGSSSGYMYLGDGNGATGAGFHFVDTGIRPHDAKNNSISDGEIDLGVSGARFKDIYATNGTIQTSDRNEKQDIAELSDAEQRVAVAAKGLLRKFRWRDAVAEKGDEARTHFGIIAQDLQAAFAAEGLDAGDYAMFISSTWTDEETGEERTRMGVRYSELLAFIIAAI